MDDEAGLIAREPDTGERERVPQVAAHVMDAEFGRRPDGAADRLQLVDRLQRDVITSAFEGEDAELYRALVVPAQASPEFLA